MIALKGMSWDHPRGFDPMVATAKEYSRRNPNVIIEWEKRPLQAFAAQPIEQMVYDYDLIVIDHPHVGEAVRKNLLFDFDSVVEYQTELKNLS